MKSADSTPTPEGAFKVLLLTSVTDMSDSYVAAAPPMGLYRLAHQLKRAAIACEVCDLSIAPERQEECVRRVRSGEFAVVGMSVSHHNMVPDLRALWELRTAAADSPRPVLFAAGGQEASLNPEEWLKAGIDLIFLGFAEKTFAAFCSRLAHGTPDADPHERAQELARELDGVAWRDASATVHSRPAQPLTQEEFEDLSYHCQQAMEVPFEHYWDLLRGDSDDLSFNRNKFIAETVRLYTSSHCPRGCGFCSSQSFLPVSQQCRSAIFMLSAEQVFDLVLHHVEHFGARGFLFADDDFLVGSRTGLRRTLDFCRMLRDAREAGKIPAGVVFNCQARVSDFFTGHGADRQLHTEVLEALADAGFHNIGLGVETFSDRLLRSPSVNKVSANEADCIAVLDALLDAGLVPTINIILMIPESTPEDLVYSMKRAAQYALRGCQVAVTTQMSAFPGAPVVGRDGYRHHSEHLSNPFTGETVEFSDYFIPADPDLERIMHTLKAASAAEVEQVSARYFPDHSTLPKLATGLSIFTAACRLLGRSEDAEHFLAAIRGLAAEPGTEPAWKDASGV